MDQKVRHQLNVVSDLAASASEELAAHVNAAAKAFANKDAAGHKSALDLISKFGVNFVAKADQTHAAIEKGAPTGTVDGVALDEADRRRAERLGKVNPTAQSQTVTTDKVIADANDPRAKQNPSQK